MATKQNKALQKGSLTLLPPRKDELEYNKPVSVHIQIFRATMWIRWLKISIFCILDAISTQLLNHMYMAYSLRHIK